MLVHVLIHYECIYAQELSLFLNIVMCFTFSLGKCLMIVYYLKAVKYLMRIYRMNVENKNIDIKVLLINLHRNKRFLNTF